MRKLTTALMVLSLVLGGVALSIAADVPQTTLGTELSGFQKITDQEAQEIRGTGLQYGPNFGGFGGTCPNPDCPQIQTVAITPAPQPRTQSQTQTSYVSSPAGVLQRPQDRTQSNWP